MGWDWDGVDGWVGFGWLGGLLSFASKGERWMGEEAGVGGWEGGMGMMGGRRSKPAWKDSRGGGRQGTHSQPSHAGSACSSFSSS